MKARNQYDIAIVGGGMVGAVLAVALSRTGFSVALVEAKRPAEFNPDSPYDLRQSAIAPAQKNLLDNLGLWDYIAQQRACPFTGMKVWEAGSDNELFLENTEIGVPHLGHIVDNGLIVASAWRRLDSVDVYCPAKLAHLHITDGAATLTLDDERQIHASLVVGAEGANSPVRQAVGIETTGWSYHQRCTVGAVTTEKQHRHIAWQRYTPTGPVAFLPLSDGRCSLAWHADDEVALELAELDEATFCQRLTEASGGVLGEVTAIEARGAFPLRLQHAKTYCKPRVVLVGDAAHVVHPMAGQGVNLGLLDVAQLVQALEDGRTAGRDPGTLTYLKRYQRERMAENLMMLGATDVLKRLFGSRSTVLEKVRSGAIGVAAGFAPIRQIMIHHATGAGRSGPRLAMPRRTGQP